MDHPMCGSTGKASLLINAKTVDSVIIFRSSKKAKLPNSEKKLQEKLDAFRDINTIIITEAGQIGGRHWIFISEQLKLIAKGLGRTNWDNKFGNFSIVTDGDTFQLEPVLVLILLNRKI